MKEKWYKSGLFCLLMSLVVLNIGADETPSAQQKPTGMECDETCSGNQKLFDNCTCGCEEGFEKDDQDFNCVKSVCDPECPSMDGVICLGNECVCEKNYCNKNGKPGAPNCVLNTTAQFTEQRLATKPALPTDNNMTTPVCDPPCEGKGVVCQRKECDCEKEYSNENGKPGTPNCVLNTTTQFTEQTLATKPVLPTDNNIPTPILTTNSTNVTLPHTPTTQNSTAPKATSLTPTSQGTLTIHLNITTITQDSNPMKKPDEQKYVMGKWAITGIIVLVACLVGALVYVCYKNRHRGSLRIATSTTL